jgi:hypothetical protein
MLIDELFDEYSLGHARVQWYKEFAQLSKNMPVSV